MMAQSLMPTIEDHFANHGWRPILPFNCAMHDKDTGRAVTYWRRMDTDEIKVFIIDSFSEECPQW